jgi:prevent-host-death family protein
LHGTLLRRGLTFGALCVSMLNMKTATVREVQHHFNKVLAWVAKGEEVHVTRRSKPVAKLVPPEATSAPQEFPDFAARARSIWGDKPSGENQSRTVRRGREERV